MQQQPPYKLGHPKNPKTRSYFWRHTHPFHILRPSIYPHIVGFFVFVWLVPQVFYLHNLELPLELPRATLMHFGFLGFYTTVMSWFFEVIRESGRGYHTRAVQRGLRMGMVLFILSEVMFFFAFFWSFFHYTLVPSVAIGAVWPPIDTQPLDPWGLPWVNTMLLLSSGVTITIAHAYLLKDHVPALSENQRRDFKRLGFQWYLFLTVLLGFTFLLCQLFEYKYGVKFSWRENLYGSIFFITTGFHGLHVTIGTMFLAFCLTREYLTRWPWIHHQYGETMYKLFGQKLYKYTLPWKYSFERKHHLGFEAAAWYWHFVDVVWLFLFISIYWWGGRE